MTTATQPRQLPYGLQITTGLSFDDAIVRIKDALKNEGFGVLTEIDVQRTLKEKRGLDFRSYKILGACNPDYAHRALDTELDIGLLLPCNVVVYETDDGTVVETIDPVTTLGRVQNPALEPLGREVKAALLRALGIDVRESPQADGAGSTDFGNVSQRVPAVGAYLRICGPEAGWHSTAVAEATTTAELPLTITGASRLTRPRRLDSSGAMMPTTPVGSGSTVPGCKRPAPRRNPEKRSRCARSV